MRHGEVNVLTRKIRSFSIKNTVKRFQLRFFVLFFVILIIPLKNSYSLPKCSKQDLIDKTFVGVRDVYLHNCTGMVAKEEGYYDGEWRHNNYNGKGKYFWLDNYDYYEGDFKDGESHGQGTYIFSNGKKKEGEYLNGEFLG